MSVFSVFPGIRFNDCVFTEPTRLAAWTPARCASLFVILANDIRWAPKPFRPLYFGEFGNGEHQTLTPNGWLPSPFAVDGLFVATLTLPFSTAAERYALRNEFIESYSPIFQVEAARTSTRELAQKLDAIEARQREQNAHIMALLTQLNRIFEPQPLPARRPIGFVA
jgi:hypothetical protein